MGGKLAFLVSVDDCEVYSTVGLGPREGIEMSDVKVRVYCLGRMHASGIVAENAWRSLAIWLREMQAGATIPVPDYRRKMSHYGAL